MSVITTVSWNFVSESQRSGADEKKKKKQEQKEEETRNKRTNGLTDGRVKNIIHSVTRCVGHNK